MRDGVRKVVSRWRTLRELARDDEPPRRRWPKWLAIGLAAGALAWLGIAHAQLPTYIDRTLNGGWRVSKPGELPTYVDPAPGGGWRVSKPGQLPTYIDRTPYGWRITNPNGEERETTGQRREGTAR